MAEVSAWHRDEDLVRGERSRLSRPAGRSKTDFVDVLVITDFALALVSTRWWQRGCSGAYPAP